MELPSTMALCLDLATGGGNKLRFKGLYGCVAPHVPHVEAAEKLAAFANALKVVRHLVAHAALRRRAFGSPRSHAVHCPRSPFARPNSPRPRAAATPLAPALSPLPLTRCEAPGPSAF